jgi:[ribosomal protein S5]-alanine N-acetyltransferase
MLNINFDPFPTLETPRFLLRRSTPDDIPPLFAMRSDPNVMRFIPRPLCQTLEDAEKVYQMMDDRIHQNLGINWAISWREEPTSFIGVMGLFRIDTDNHRAEIGYMLPPEHWGKGIVSELIPYVTAYGFSSLNLHTMEAIIDPENHASRRVLEKNGFIQEAHIRENCLFEGKFLDTVILSLRHP